MRVFDKNSNIFRLLSESISQGILVVNEQQEIVASNQRSDQLFGYDKDELLGQQLSILIPSAQREKHKKLAEDVYWEDIGIREMKGRNLSGLHKNGEQIPLQVGLSPFSLYGNKYVLTLIEDLSEIKEKDNQIYELNTQLEKKIRLRTQELRDTVAILKREVKRRKEAEDKIKDALQRERELNDLKTKFLSLVSHEFKTPLSGILTAATLVGKYNTEEGQGKREKHLKTIIGEVRRLNTILTDFLSIERLEQGKEVYRLADFSLSKVVNEVIYDANMILKDGQKINYPQNIDDTIINQDERIVGLALTNLLHNAIKYSSEDTEIDFRVNLSENKITFHIKDQGIGIPEADQKHIFDRYFRAENVLLTQGTGIGLNIIKAHIENLGGSIYFKSKENTGSVFTMELPLART
ncbi:PAS domain-containing sensor histidine kinase [Ulvibacterium marinum]|uniref:histidine kinase n=1 Tax=Ulvibacterium marinum TaxID=2419782 RepID=A0A3B0CD06_9FLAO|nr:ATP-binding protein [Ulvibacterium marinum]RKN81737.1 PAS domain S-box protein [Ulvibacterium marinum]